MSTPILRTISLGVSQSGRNILRDITLDLGRGSFIALLGPNGAGKSTLLRALAGLGTFSGQILLDGVSIATIPRTVRARRIGYLPQGHQTHWPMPVRDIVGLGRFPHGAADPRRLGADDLRAVEGAMRLTGIDALADRPATGLSGGERARVALARVVALGAPVILADEPTASLDPRYQIEIMELLANIARRGALVIAATHDLALTIRHADFALVLDAGATTAFGPARQVLDDTLLNRVFGLRRATDTTAATVWERAE